MRGPRHRVAALCTFVISSAIGFTQAQAGLLDDPPDARTVCAAAAQAAEAQYSLPTGLLYAIGLVESGRPVGGSAVRQPWPWTVQAENQSYYFTTKAAAIRWVQQAQSRGVSSIDVGCMQVNLQYHPAAFRSLSEAFDPGRNADYAARFLTALHTETGDWHVAAGRYHSETLALALPYRRRVEAALADGGPPPRDARVAALEAAWGATLGSAAPQASPPEPGLSGDWSTLLPKPVPKHQIPRMRHRVIMLSDAR